MADAGDWRNSLSAAERYENIQRLAKAAAGIMQSAFAVESDAYKNANNREEYDAACNPSSSRAAVEPDAPALEAPERDELGSGLGITIGHYQDCHYIASGVTAEVYRSQARALKVIVETHNIEPHDPHREAKILVSLRDDNTPNIIPLLETFRDGDQRLVLVFPYMPLTLAHLLDQVHSPLSYPLIRHIFTSLFLALSHLHAQGIIHRDIKPSALLLSAIPTDHHQRQQQQQQPPPPPPPPPFTFQTYLSDFGTAYHPLLSAATEPATAKVLDVGTGPYRAPECLFGNRAYTSAADLWAAGTVLAECVARPRPRPLFDSPPAHEDGNQLGLILSIFRTIGSPTRETWPEAEGFRTPPFEMYRVFEGRPWEEVLEGVDDGWRALVAGLVRYESGKRVSASEALQFPCMKGEGEGEGGGEG
ncbi:mitogen-activated protein kinase [Madurella fahalii]|uniref:cyclin-dependent kinase n=1 Tax=Madurella fahalii TaxID=1157608 RepID=A0ABQ0GPA0_9PEZI